MRKSRLVTMTLVLASLPGTSLAMPVGDASCVPGKPSVLVRLVGLKKAQGNVRVTLYGADQSRWLVKHGWVEKVKVPVTANSMDVCLDAPGPGTYGVAIHHDLNSNGKRDLSDGGGFSNNPKVTLFNPKPKFSEVSFGVGPGPVRIAIRPLYVSGLSVRAIDQ